MRQDENVTIANFKTSLVCGITAMKNLRILVNAFHIETSVLVANTIDGNTYGRAHQAPDWVLDYWHPLEKAQYPEYFLRREKRKQEFLK
ncbi:unnamed protein product, partial [Nesidiocoris tenuis]